VHWNVVSSNNPDLHLELRITLRKTTCPSQLRDQHSGCHQQLLAHPSVDPEMRCIGRVTERLSKVRVQTLQMPDGRVEHGFQGGGPVTKDCELDIHTPRKGLQASPVKPLMSRCLGAWASGNPGLVTEAFIQPDGSGDTGRTCAWYCSDHALIAQCWLCYCASIVWLRLLRPPSRIVYVTVGTTFTAKADWPFNASENFAVKGREHVCHNRYALRCRNGCTTIETSSSACLLCRTLDSDRTRRYKLLHRMCSQHFNARIRIVTTKTSHVRSNCD
jgi:hypothetical protein